MKLTIIILLSILLFFSCAKAKEKIIDVTENRNDIENNSTNQITPNVGGIIYGDNYAIIVKAPTDWIMDSETWSEMGINGLFYKEGKSEFDSPGGQKSVVFIMTKKLENPTDENLEEIFKSDNSNIKNDGWDCEEINYNFKNLNDQKLKYLTVNANSIDNSRFMTIVSTRYKDNCIMISLTVWKLENRTKLFGKLEEVIESLGFIDIIH